MRIKNIDGLSSEEILKEKERGGKFIYYPFTVSLLITFKKKSGVYLVRIGENVVRKGLPYTIISALFGWWGIPSGPKHTIQSILTNLKGGKDVTEEVIATVNGHILFQEAEQRKKSN